MRAAATICCWLIWLSLTGPAALSNEPGQPLRTAAVDPKIPHSAGRFDPRGRAMAGVPVARDGLPPSVIATLSVSRKGRLLASGYGAPGRELSLLRNNKVIATTRVDQTGKWHVMPRQVLRAGNHRLVLETIHPNQVLTRVGDEVRLSIPSRTGTGIDLKFHHPGYLQRYAQMIGDQASKEFDAFLTNQENRSAGDPIAQIQATSKPPPPGGDTVSGPAVDWLDHSNTTYLQQIIPRLQLGGGLVLPPPGQRPQRMSDIKLRRIDFPNSETIIKTMQSWFGESADNYDGEILPRLSGATPPPFVVPSEVTKPPPQHTGSERDRLDLAQQRAEHERRRAEQARRQAQQERRRAEADRRRVEAERRARQERQQQNAEIERQRREQETRLRLEAEQRAQELRLAAARRRQREADAAAERKAEAERQRQHADVERQLALRRQQDAEKRAAAERAAAERAAAERAAAERAAAERAAAERAAAERAAAERAAEKRAAAERAAAERAAEKRAAEKRAAEERARQAAARQRAEQEAVRQRRVRIGELPPAPRRNTWQRQAAGHNTQDQHNRLAAVWRRAKQFARRLTAADEPEPVQEPERALPQLGRQARVEAAARPRSVPPRPVRKTTGQPAARTPRAKQQRPPSTPTTTPTSTPQRVANDARRDVGAGRRSRTAVRGYRQRARRRGHGCRKRSRWRVKLPGKYVVRRGDSLWRIARRHYRRGRRYRIIYRANRRKIRNPHLIYPCQRFDIPRQTARRHR